MATPKGLSRLLQGFQSSGGMDAIQNYIQNQQKQKMLNQLADLQKKTANDFQAEIQPQISQQQIPFMADMATPGVGSPLSKLGIPDLEQTAQIETGPTEQEISRAYANKMIDFQNEGSKLGADELMLNQHLKGLNMLMGSYMPKPAERFNVSDGTSVVDYNPNTKQYKEVYRNPKDNLKKGSNASGYELDEKGNPKVYTMANGQLAYKKLTKDSEGTRINEDYEPLTKYDGGGTGGEDDVDISEEMGSVAGAISALESPTADEDNSIKAKYRLSATDAAVKALNKVGLPEDKGVIPELWRIARISEADTPEEKRTKLRTALDILKQEGQKLLPKQEQAIQAYINAKTR